jgi:hypothetical protein
MPERGMFQLTIFASKSGLTIAINAIKTAKRINQSITDCKSS